jgi:hypothetical protein
MDVGGSENKKALNRQKKLLSLIYFRARPFPAPDRQTQLPLLAGL